MGGGCLCAHGCMCCVCTYVCGVKDISACFSLSQHNKLAGRIPSIKPSLCGQIKLLPLVLASKLVIKLNVAKRMNQYGESGQMAPCGKC